MTGREMIRVIEQIGIACEEYRRVNDCKDCPMAVYCPEDMTYNDFVFNIPADVIDEMLEAADKL